MCKKFLILSLILCPVFVLAADKIDINTAALQQLDKLAGVGPVIAQRIIDGRPYSSVDGLDKVKGIGPATLQKIKSQGLACIYCVAQTEMPEPAPALAPASISPPAPTPIVVYPSGVFINEILPHPMSPEEKNEWIELYNSNNVEADLSGWKLQNTAGTITVFVIPQNIKISANGYLIFKRPDTKIMLHDDSDGLNLLSPDGKTADSVIFEKAPENQSYNKTSSGWQWSTTLTPGTLNIITAAIAKNTNKSLPKTEKSDKLNNINAAGLTTSINNFQINKSSGAMNPWVLFFTVLAITIVSAAVVLFIKLKLKNVRT